MASGCCHDVGGSCNSAIVHAGAANHILRDTLSEIQQKLQPVTFLRISRSAVVALRQVRGIENDSTGKPVAILNNGTRIQVTLSNAGLKVRLG